MIKYYCDLCGKEVGNDRQGRQEIKISSADEMAIDFGMTLSIEPLDPEKVFKSAYCVHCVLRLAKQYVDKMVITEDPKWNTVEREMINELGHDIAPVIISRGIRSWRELVGITCEQISNTFVSLGKPSLGDVAHKIAKALKDRGMKFSQPELRHLTE